MFQSCSILFVTFIPPQLSEIRLDSTFTVTVQSTGTKLMKCSHWQLNGETQKGAFLPKRLWLWKKSTWFDELTFLKLHISFRYIFEYISAQSKDCRFRCHHFSTKRTLGNDLSIASSRRMNIVYITLVLRHTWKVTLPFKLIPLADEENSSISLHVEKICLLLLCRFQHLATVTHTDSRTWLCQKSSPVVKTCGVS